MPWWFHVVESKHELQNPTSNAKIRLLGESTNLGADWRVLDVGSGRGGPAVILARSFGCHLTCVEQSDEFVDVARRRVEDAGVEARVELLTADADDFRLEADHYDAELAWERASSGAG